MANFCTLCGKPLVIGGKFCTGCGAPTTAHHRPVPPQALQLQPTPQPTQPVPITAHHRPVPSQALQLQATQQPAQPAPQPAPQPQQQAIGQTQASARPVMQAVQGLTQGGGVVSASAGAGEVAFDFTQSPASGAMASSGTAKVLAGGVKNLVTGVGAAFKNPKTLIPVGIMAVLWILQTALPALGIALPVDVARVLGFLTFAQGGLQGGVWQVIGGTIGKGVLAGFVASLFAGGNPFAGMGRGLNGLISSLRCKSGGDVGPLLIGVGVALVLYNFLAGRAQLSAAMAAIPAFLLSLRALGSQSGFLRRLAGSLVDGRGKPPGQELTQRLMGGFAAGFALAVAVSAIPFMAGMLCYLLGGALLIAGVVTAVATRPQVQEA